MVEEREVATQTPSPDHTHLTGKQRENNNNVNTNKAQQPVSEPEVPNQSKKTNDEEYSMDIPNQDKVDEEGGEKVEESAGGLEQVPGPLEERRQRVSVRKRTVSLEKAGNGRERRTVWRREEEETVLVHEQENTNSGLTNTGAVASIQHSELTNTPLSNNARIKISTR